MSEIYNSRVVKIRTTPCRSQSNGVVKRLHGTLVPMISKDSQGKVLLGETGALGTICH